MFNLYIFEIILTILTYIAIKLYKDIKIHNIKKNERTGALISYKKGKLFLLPVILFCIILVQIIFEVPQVPHTLEINVGEKIADTDYKIISHNKDVTDKIQELQNIDTSKINTYKMNISVPYLNRYITKEIDVQIVDKKAPLLEVELVDNSYMSYTTDFKNIKVNIVDNIDTNLENNLNITKTKLINNTYIISYLISDNSGNQTKKDYTVTLIDDVKPKIFLKGDNEITLNLNDKYVEQGAIAKDEICGDLTKDIKIKSNVDTSIVGNYKVEYTVTDKSGNTSCIERKINVVDEGNGTIYLTFDDGPSSNITPYILDTLKEKNVKATFFIINYDPQNEYLIRRIVNEGHTIAIHGYSHTYSQIYKSDDSFIYNITTLREKIKNTTGIDTKIFRFPGGSSNTVSRKYSPGIMSRLTSRLTNDGYIFFDWNIDSNDAGGASSKYEIYNNVTSALSKDKPNVILMHDAPNKIYTLEALSDIIDYGIRNGYKFSNITEKTKPVKHSVNN